MTRPAAAPALGELHTVLEALAAAGRVPVCAGRTEWISDDHGDRAEAARLCSWCPASQICRISAAASGITFGIWGGLDLGDRTAVRGLIAELENPA